MLAFGLVSHRPCLEVADGVDEAGHDSEDEQEERERSVLFVWPEQRYSDHMPRTPRRCSSNNAARRGSARRGSGAAARLRLLSGEALLSPSSTNQQRATAAAASATTRSGTRVSRDRLRAHLCKTTVRVCAASSSQPPSVLPRPGHGWNGQSWRVDSILCTATPSSATQKTPKLPSCTLIVLYKVAGGFVESCTNASVADLRPRELNRLLVGSGSTTPPAEAGRCELDAQDSARLGQRFERYSGRSTNGGNAS